MGRHREPVGTGALVGLALVWAAASFAVVVPWKAQRARTVAGAPALPPPSPDEASAGAERAPVAPAPAPDESAGGAPPRGE